MNWMNRVGIILLFRLKCSESRRALLIVTCGQRVQTGTQGQVATGHRTRL